MYDLDKKFGFIIGEDRNDYFFHVSQVKSNDIPAGLKEVEFKANMGEKGLFASEIKILKGGESKVIVLGDEKLKVSSIKDCGIAVEVFYYQKIYKRVVSTSANKMLAFFGNHDVNYVDTGEWYKISYKRYEAIKAGEDSYYYIIKAKKDECIGKYRVNQSYRKIMAPFDGLFDLNKSKYAKYLTEDVKVVSSDVMKNEEEFLNIRTNQGKSYKIFKSEPDFNMYDKLKEINKALSIL